MAKETPKQKKARERKNAARRARRAEARLKGRTAPPLSGEEIDTNFEHRLDHQIGRLSYQLSQLRNVAELVRPVKPRGVERLHRRVRVIVEDKAGVRISGAVYDLAPADDLEFKVNADDGITVSTSHGDR